MEQFYSQMKKEEKRPADLLSDGALAYGTVLGRFVFEEERRIVYAVSELMHIAGADVSMVYQISKQDYLRLKEMSAVDQLPEIEVPIETIEECHCNFLCGESAYCIRNRCTLEDTDLSLTEEF